MDVNAYDNSIEVVTTEDWQALFDILDSNDNPADLSGAALRATIKLEDGTEIADVSTGEGTLTVSDPDNARVLITVPKSIRAAVTIAKPTIAFADVMGTVADLRDENETVERWMGRLTILIKPGITE